MKTTSMKQIFTSSNYMKKNRLHGRTENIIIAICRFHLMEDKLSFSQTEAGRHSYGSCIPTEEKLGNSSHLNMVLQTRIGLQMASILFSLLPYMKTMM